MSFDAALALSTAGSRRKPTAAAMRRAARPACRTCSNAETTSQFGYAPVSRHSIHIFDFSARALAYCFAPSARRRPSDTAYGAARAASIGSAEGSTPLGSTIGL